MTPKGLRDYILDKLSLEEADWPAAKMLATVNVKLQDICEAITEAYQGFFGVYSEFNLVASTTADKREYPLPTDILNNLYKVELKLDGINFVPARKTNIIPGKDFRLEEAWITNNYNNSYPKYAVFRNSLFILSGEIKAVTNGGRLWYINYPDPIPNLTENAVDLSVATDNASAIKVGFPTQFHELLARAVILDYKERNNLPLAVREPLYEQDLETKIKRLRGMDLDEVIMAAIPDYGDGSEY